MLFLNLVLSDIIFLFPLGTYKVVNAIVSYFVKFKRDIIFNI